MLQMQRMARWTLMLAVAGGVMGAQSAQAYQTMEAYIPPEITYADNLRQSVSLSEKVNINRVSMGQLMSLPGFDENLALKVMRHRPFTDVQEFYNIPGITRREADRLIQLIQPLIIFK